MADVAPIPFHAIAVEAALLLSMRHDPKGSEPPQFSEADLDHLRESLEALFGTGELMIAVESLVRLAAYLHQAGSASQAARALLEVASLAVPALAGEHEARADADRAREQRFRRFRGERSERPQWPEKKPDGSIALRDVAPRKAIR